MIKKLTIILLFLAVLILFAEADWTILVYMAADNGLTEAARADIDEMERALIPDNINVIVQADFADYDFGDDRAFRYQIIHDEEEGINSRVIRSLGEIDSGDWRTLADFMEWGFDRYPAEHKAVFIWSHGEGWDELDYYKSKYICPDDESESKFYVSKGDLRKTFEEIPKLDLLVLDACNMQTVEVITEVFEQADYIVGSIHDVPADGMPYDDLFTAWDSFPDFEEFVKAIPTIYVDSYLAGGSQNPNSYTPEVTCSVVKSDNFETGIINSIKELVEDETIDSEDWINIRDDLRVFNTRSMDVDIKELAMRLNDIGKSSLLEAVENAFIAYSSTLESPNVGTGIIWFPDYRGYLQSSYGRYYNLQFERLTHWGKILNSYYAPEYINLRIPNPVVRTNSSSLMLSWDPVPYPSKVIYHIDVYNSDNIAFKSIKTEDVNAHIRTMGEGFVEIKAVVPELRLESEIKRYDFSLSGAYVFPNPVTSLLESKLRVYLTDDSSYVEIALFDISGNRICKKKYSNLKQGEIIIPLEEITKAQLSTGNYFLTIRGNNLFKRVKLSFVK